MNVHFPKFLKPAVAIFCFAAMAGTPVEAQRFADPMGIQNSTPRLEEHRGLAMPSRSVTLSSPVDGALASIFAAEGDTVKAGDLIAQMDDAVQAAVVETARVRMDSDAAIKRAAAERKAAEAELDRVRRSHERKAASELEMLRAEMRFESADADLDQANESHAIDMWTLRLEQARLDEYSLRAPFDGVVVMHEAEPGMSLQQATPVVTLAKIDTLEAEIHLSVDFGMPEVGRQYTLKAGSPVKRDVTATLTFVSPMIDPASRTFRCKFTISNEDFALPAGFDVHLASLKPIENDVVSTAE